MERIYNKYKDQEVTINGFTGKLAGYSEDRFLLAAENAPSYSFRRLDKGSFIDEKYKDSKYRYWYCNETILDKQLGKSDYSLTRI